MRRHRWAVERKVDLSNRTGRRGDHAWQPTGIWFEAPNLTEALVEFRTRVTKDLNRRVNGPLQEQGRYRLVRQEDVREVAFTVNAKVVKHVKLEAVRGAAA